ncbi:MAG: hypothetical protein ACM3JB_22630 [Acidobacteriaceae bacterium]
MFCQTYSILLDRNAIASAHYHEAITKLSRLAGGNEREAFDDAKSACQQFLEECKHTSRRLREHRVDHGC